MRENNAVEMETVNITASAICQSPVNSNTIKVVDIGASNTAAATAPIPAKAYNVTVPETSGKTLVAINPKANPVSAPIIKAGESTPPPPYGQPS